VVVVVVVVVVMIVVVVMTLWNWVSAQGIQKAPMMGLPDGQKSFTTGLVV